MLALLSNIGFGAMWKWLTSPTGRVAVALILLGVWTWYQRADAAHEAHEAAWAKVAAEYQRQQAEAAILKAEARDRADAAEEKIRELTEMKDEIVEAAGDDACDIPDGVRERLRTIQ